MRFLNSRGCLLGRNPCLLMTILGLWEILGSTNMTPVMWSWAFWSKLWFFNTPLVPGFMRFLYSCGCLSVTYQWFGKTTVGLWEILGPVNLTPFMWLRGFWSKYKLWCTFSDLIAHLCSSERSGVLIECGCVYFVFLVGAGEEAKYRWFCQGCSCQGSPNWGVSLFPQVWSKWWVNISVACTYLLTVEKFPT
jgi:hypothetical protein